MPKLTPGQLVYPTRDGKVTNDPYSGLEKALRNFGHATNFRLLKYFHQKYPIGIYVMDAAEQVGVVQTRNDLGNTSTLSWQTHRIAERKTIMNNLPNVFREPHFWGAVGTVAGIIAVTTIPDLAQYQEVIGEIIATIGLFIVGNAVKNVASAVKARRQ